MSNIEKLISYEGNEPYIFISYSHEDKEEVEAVIADLQNKGYRFWYDGGIAPSSEWIDYIAEHIQNCEYFLAFLSEDYMSSNNCRAEFVHSYSSDRKHVFINLDDVKLSGGMAMYANITQSIYKSKLENGEKIIDKILEVKDIENCRNTKTNSRLIEKSNTSAVPNAEIFFKAMYNDPAFLDKEKGKEIKLKDIYVLPNYHENGYYGTLDNLDERLQSFLNEDQNKFLMIFGAPGIGKSTLISHLLYSGKFNLPDKFKVYRIKDLPCFKSFESIDNLPYMILDDLALIDNDLSNTLLVFDGLDEIELGEGGQADLIDELYKHWIEYSDFINFKLIITCRTARISSDAFNTIKPDYITLKPFSSEKVKEFIEKYTGERNDKELPVNEKSIEAINGLLENETIDDEPYKFKSKTSISQVMSIPLILYMVISLGIEIEKNSDLVSIYNRIFSIDNERSIYNHAKESDRDIALKKSERKKIHEFSKFAAVKMWEINPEEAVLEKKEYEEIAKKVDPKGNIHKLFSGQYFVEGSENRKLYFAHRSMYEYFVALSYFEKLKAVIDILPEIKEKYKSKCVSDLLEISSVSDLEADINNEILAFIMKFFKNEKTDLKEVQVKAFFDEMLENRLPKAIAFENKLEAFNIEVKIFRNLFFIIKKLLESIYPDRKLNILSENCIKYYTMHLVTGKRFDFRNLKMYAINLDFANLKNAILSNTNLTGSSLRNTDLHRGNLSGANLLGTSLHRADLSFADLRNANLSCIDSFRLVLFRADLSGADLYKAELEAAILAEAFFNGANLSNANLSNADLSNADLSGAILIGADLGGAFLDGAKFEGANIYGCKATDEQKKYMLEHGAVEIAPKK